MESEGKVYVWVVFSREYDSPYSTAMGVFTNPEKANEAAEKINGHLIAWTWITKFELNFNYMIAENGNDWRIRSSMPYPL